MSAADLAVVQSIFALWGAGGFHGPEKEEIFDKYCAADCVIDYRFNPTSPELKQFDGVFHGNAGFFQNMGIHGVFDWSDMKFDFTAGGPGNSILVHMDCLPIRGETGKVASMRCLCIMQCFLEEGKLVKSVYYFSGTEGWDELFKA